MKIYNKAPLPFQGQKRNFLKAFREQLREFPSDATYVDLFGGTGLLSHTIKCVHPDARVIYNDFDDYHQRLQDVGNTNVIISDIRGILGDIPKKERLKDSTKQRILGRLQQETGNVDYYTISSSLLFSGNYAQSYDELASKTFYNWVVNTDFNTDGYLHGVDIVSMDYRKLFELYKDHDNVVFILDPPYLSTDVKTYKNMTYWTLTTYLDILNTMKNQSYFYFTSEKSQLVELMEWLRTSGGYSPFSDAIKVSVRNSVNYGYSYQDIMYCKQVEKT